MASLGCVRPFGLMINFGNASGAVPPVDMRVLSGKSVSIVRCGVGNYIGDGDVLRAAAAGLFDLVKSGAIKIEVSRTFPLSEAARAHAEIEARRNTGSMLLIP
jgi:NADPH2:quinone reductase